MELTEQSLIRRAMVGDASAFGRLVQMHQSPVRTFLRRTLRGDVATADDLAQETFLLAYRKIGQYRGEGRFLSWLFRIAYSQVLQHVRRPDVRQRLDPIEDIEASFGPASEARLDVERALMCVSGPERAVLTLCFAFDMTHEEAAATLDMPLGTLKSHVARAKDKLKRVFTPQAQEVAP